MRELIRKATDDSQYGKIVGEINVEIDARVRAEEAEEAKARAAAERDEAARAERKILQAVGAVRTLFERARGGDPAKEEEVSDVLRGIGAMRNERDALANAWDAWREAIDAEAAAAGRIEELEAFRNRTSQSPDAVYLDEARKELSWSQAVSETVKAADAAEATLAKWLARAPAKPVVDHHPVPWPSFRFQAMVRERMRTWRLPEFDPDPEAWWATLLGAGLTGFAWAIHSLSGRWTPVILVGGSGAFVLANGLFDLGAGYFDPKPTWRPFRRFLAFCVAGWVFRHWFEWPVLGWAATATGAVCLLAEFVTAARAGARKRKRHAFLDVRAKWLSEEIAKRWPDPETEKRWNSLRSDQEPLSGQRDACSENGVADSVRLDRWRALWNRLESLRAWDADHAQWDVRRQALLDEASDRVHDVRDAVDAVVRDAVQLRSINHERTAAAEEAVETAVAAAEKSAAAFPAAVVSARAAAETAAHGADAARRAWEAAKAATDAAVAKEEEQEKRRAEARIEFARLKDRTIPEIRKRLETVREVSAMMPEIAEPLGKLDDDLSVWEGRHSPVGGNLEKENSFAAQLMERANALAEDGRKAVQLVDIANRAGERAGEAHVDNDAPPFATAEIATVRVVLEIVAHQTDWKKSEKAARILQKAEERKRRLDALVGEWRELAHRLEEIGRLEEQAEAAWKGLLWRNPSLAPRLDQMAVSVQTSRQFEDALLRITEYTNALNVSLEQLNEERTRQLESFQAATKRLGNRRAILDHFKPRPADLFERTRQGSFDDRCYLICDWYELLFSLYGERQRNAMEGGVGGTFPARAFLRLCEIAGTISVHDEIVRTLAAKSRDWDALSGQIEEMMPVDEGQNDDGHRRMFKQATTAVHELTKLCDACSVQSVEVRGAFQRLCEASEWIRNNRLPRKNALSARQRIEKDFQELDALDMPINPVERDQLLGQGDSLLQQSDFQGSKDAFESSHVGLADRIRQLTPRLVLRIAMPEKCRTLTTTFSVVSPQGNLIRFNAIEPKPGESDELALKVVYNDPGFRCYVAGQTPVGTFSNSVDVGLIDWHGIRKMDVSLWADRFSFPLSRTSAPLEFRRAPNGLWYCVQATTITQFRALVTPTQHVNVFDWLRSNVCAGMTWNEAVSFATKVTNYALETGFRLPDGTTPIFRLPSPAEWKLGSQYWTNTFSSVYPRFQEWCTERDGRYAFHCTIKVRNNQWLFHQDWDCKTDSFPFGTGYDSVGFRLVCESDR